MLDLWLKLGVWGVWVGSEGQTLLSGIFFLLENIYNYSKQWNKALQNKNIMERGQKRSSQKPKFDPFSEAFPKHH